LGYFASIALIDREVGRVLATLQEEGLKESTLVIFTSDYGEMLGDYGTYQKWLPYDSCAKIPFIVHFPAKMAGGKVNDEFVDLNDLLLTILDAAGIQYPGEHELPGESLLTREGRKTRTHQYFADQG
jgi:arylsulfatase A-like enzyme